MNINQYIDHTLLKPEATTKQIEALCHEAIKYKFAAVCVNSVHVPLAFHLLKDKSISVCTVVGFPLGASPCEVKALEAQLAIKAGASEIDMVLNIGALKDENYHLIKAELSEMVKVCHDSNAILKVILETCLLDEKEIIKACELCKSAKADFVKTSTGFSHSGASLEVVKLMKDIVGEDLRVKASGGVKTKEDALKMIECGASRIGTSSGIKLVTGQGQNSDY